MVTNSSEKTFFNLKTLRDNFWILFKDMNESEESPKQHQFPLKIEWPSRKNFGFDEDDSDERADSGVGESVSESLLSKGSH